MTYNFETRSLTAQDTAVVRDSVPVAELPARLARAYREVRRHLTERRIRIEGPFFARYSFRGAVVDVEAGFPVPGPVPPAGRVVASRLPGGPALVTTHEGDFDDLGLARLAVADRFKEQGLEPAGPHWEVYYTSPATRPAPSRWSTDLVAPRRHT